MKVELMQNGEENVVQNGEENVVENFIPTAKAKAKAKAKATAKANARAHLEQLLHAPAESSQQCGRYFKALKGVNSRGKQKEPEGEKVLELYVKCIKFVETLQPGKPRADRCIALQHAVEKYIVLRENIAAGTIPEVPSTDISAKAKCRARCYENVKKRKEEESEEKRRKLEEKERELKEIGQMMLEDSVAQHYKSMQFCNAWMTARMADISTVQDENAAKKKELEAYEQFLAKTAANQREWMLNQRR